MRQSPTRLLSLLFLSFFALNSFSSLAQNIQHLPELNQARVFESFDGAVLILDTSTDGYFASDIKMVKEGFIPASTFKIFSSLVALETGVVAFDTVLSWDGVVRERTEIN